MIEKVKECIYPESTDCRGCSHSYNPALYDGGCKLFYEGVGLANLYSIPERRPPNSHTHKTAKSKVKSGIFQKAQPFLYRL